MQGEERNLRGHACMSVLVHAEEEQSGCRYTLRYLLVVLYVRSTSVGIPRWIAQTLS